MDFVLLHEVTARVDGNPVALGERQHRLFVAILLLAESQHVPTDQLISRIWGDLPPEKPQEQLNRIVNKVRRTLADAETGADAHLPRGSGGYRLQVPRSHVDWLRFRDCRSQARELARTDKTGALDLMRAALAEWGPVPGRMDPEPLFGVNGEWISGMRVTLVNEHRAARLERAALEIETGDPGLAVGELEGLFALLPSNYRIAELLVHAYCLDGRRTDALALFPRMDKLLKKTHGEDASQSLRELHDRVLHDDESLRPRAVIHPAPESMAGKAVVPYDREQAIGQEPMTRSLVAIDAENPSRHGDPALRDDLYAIFAQARSASGVTADQVVFEDRDDGFIALIDADLMNILGSGLDALIEALRRRDQDVPEADRLRLRIAVHRGQVHRDERGLSGADLNAAFRLVASQQVKEVLQRAAKAQCVIAVSDSVYNGLIKHGHEDLCASSYGRLDDKTGWVRVPGYPHPPLHSENDDEDEADTAEPSPLAGATVNGNLFYRNKIKNLDASVNLNGRPDRERR
ncbi:BTAD domain-containing putative transcriptional regulator [Kibdelosporangium aridum]|uniref:DNA-binding transcriptional activator of the SARP family n=1 Tax=Kibdelosporangium aridum TaxID=2030 RepID=A0A1Y5Y8K6_KIBAR|nr:BTAD domain-containing putative transcriptional regulator [Kibdelosporangium aridum]SMD26210.1 DNA-binding transcriptional activator of the SARP family [Kibdelosporangium aridum]